LLSRRIPQTISKRWRKRYQTGGKTLPPIDTTQVAVKKPERIPVKGRI
jgi:hypothetical protein